jgi:hypothetical protein
MSKNVKTKVVVSILQETIDRIIAALEMMGKELSELEKSPRSTKKPNN